MRRLPSVSELRAAKWAYSALATVRRELAAGRTFAGAPGPPALPDRAWRGAEALLRRRPHTCLEEAIVRQRWLAAHGIERDVVFGVTSPSEGFVAHAWVDGEDAAASTRYHELRRMSL